MNTLKVTYPLHLPISGRIDDIKQTILNHQLIVICGETGSGKTTQLPKLLYEMGFAQRGIIGHTQPRKVAARTIAHRISYELQESNQDSNIQSDIVGYKVRFNDKTKAHTLIKLMTDGILLQEIARDKLLSEYSAIIIDEVHERSLNIDFILGYLKIILAKRPDLKILITSATIDNQKLSKYFNLAPVINVQGKTYPVDIVYQPLDKDTNLNEAIYQAIESCLNIEMGNILIFLPGEREIKDCIWFLNKTRLKNHEVLALFSRQNEAQQNLVFTQNGRLKIIVTTNVAETSLTIPGIKFVIDSGIARVKRYNVRNRVEQLQIEAISKASCRQRAGRAGRTSHGMCVYLFSEEEFNLRQDFTDPEIIRSNLANVILRLISLKLGDPLEFPFLDMPQNTAYRDGFKTLFQLGAITDDNTITSIGQKLANIPLDIMLSRTLIASATEFRCLSDALIIVSFLAIVDPRESPAEFRQYARERHLIWANKQSDFIAILNLWYWYAYQVKHISSKKKLQEVCFNHFLSPLRMREWHDLYNQLKEIIYNLGYTLSTSNINFTHKENNEYPTVELDAIAYQNLHQAILSGLLNNIGQKDLVEDYYLGANNKKLVIHPTSQINKPKWLVSAMLNQTTKLYARINAYIEPGWLIPLTKHLATYNYSSEVWDKKRGEVVATEHILLLGLTIGKRKVGFAKINPILAREIFIKQGIVLNELNKNYSFIKHNQEVIQKLEKLEDKLRLAFIIFEDELFEFYNNILPNDINDVISFELWYKENERKLLISGDELSKKLVQDKNHTELFPDYLIVAGNRLKLSYIFNPDNPLDGVTAAVFLTNLGQIETFPFSWLVPGLIREKVSFIIKSLPKSIRIVINPLNEFVTKFLDNANTSDNFTDELIKYLDSEYSIQIKSSEIDAIVLPQHLVFHFRILDKNKIVGEGDSLFDLKKTLATKLVQIVDVKSKDYYISNIESWDDNLDQLLKLMEKSIGYLSLIVVNGSQVDLVVLPDLQQAKLNTRKGLLKLIKNKVEAQLKYLEQKRFKDFTQSAVYLKDIYVSNVLLEDSIDFILRMSVDLSILPTNKVEFLNVCDLASQNIGPNSVIFAQTLYNIAKYYHEIKLQLKEHDLEEEIVLQLDDLLYNGFLRYVRYEQLKSFPRYLQAILLRLSKYNTNSSRDNVNSVEIESLYNAWYNYVDKLEQEGKDTPQSLYDFKYKIEELRVSLFAQELKTPYPVSLKRLWRELEEFDR